MAGRYYQELDKGVDVSGLDHSIYKCIKNDFFLALELKVFDN